MLLRDAGLLGGNNKGVIYVLVLVLVLVLVMWYPDEHHGI